MWQLLQPTSTDYPIEKPNDILVWFSFKQSIIVIV